MDVDAIVLFNRFFSPDIDLESMKIISAGVFSKPEELSLPLRWIGLTSGRVKCDLAASTGIHDASGIIKVILAGARVAAVTSVLYQKGIGYISTMLEELEAWMKKNNYKSVDAFRGALRRKDYSGFQKYERAQFMKYFSDHK
jgi:dihydroorotate dehydrogenase (fumarate)